MIDTTLGALCEIQAGRYPDKEAVVVAWSGTRLTFRDVNESSKQVARGLVKLGARRGSRIAVFSGDDERFILLFFAAIRIGACLVIFNKTYTMEECVRAVKHTGTLCLEHSSFRRGIVDSMCQLDVELTPVSRAISAVRRRGGE